VRNIAERLNVPMKSPLPISDVAVSMPLFELINILLLHEVDKLRMADAVQST
jgi:hypothetical protein